MYTHRHPSQPLPALTTRRATTIYFAEPLLLPSSLGPACLSIMTTTLNDAIRSTVVIPCLRVTESP